MFGLICKIVACVNCGEEFETCEVEGQQSDTYEVCSPDCEHEYLESLEK
jgi:hypothetical protein